MLAKYSLNNVLSKYDLAVTCLFTSNYYFVAFKVIFRPTEESIKMIFMWESYTIIRKTFNSCSIYFIVNLWSQKNSSWCQPSQILWETPAFSIFFFFWKLHLQFTHAGKVIMNISLSVFLSVCGKRTTFMQTHVDFLFGRQQRFTTHRNNFFWHLSVYLSATAVTLSW